MQKYYTDIIELYKKLFPSDPKEIFPLPPSGSNRKYYRIIGENSSVIAAYNPDRDENRAFVYISEKLQKEGVNVPEIYESDLDKNIYLLEDLGDTKLYDLVEEYRKNEDTEYIDWYKKVIDQMPSIQYKSADKFDFSLCFPRKAFDKQSIL
ncbi:hypothetical protein ES705_42785 [subsurface metagenome]